MCEETDQYEPFPAKCTIDATSHKKFVKKTQVFELLAGLNPNFEQIRIKLLSRETYPNLFEEYSHLHREERRRQVMFAPPTIERSPVISSSHQGDHGKGCVCITTVPNEKDKLKYQHCGKMRHAKET